MIESGHLSRAYLLVLFSCFMNACCLHSPQKRDSDVAKENDSNVFRQLINMDFYPIWTDE